MDFGIVGLLGGMAVLGFRHGFDWDHIAAITDITSTTTASHAGEDIPAIAPMPRHEHDTGPDEHGHSHAAAGPLHVLSESRFAHEQRHAVALASLYAWGRLQARIHGHRHERIAHASQYGPRTAFGVGMIHGIGAETGSQALLLAGVAGVTGAQGVVILGAFIVGLLISNTLVAVTSATGFIGAQRLRTLYVIVGAIAGVSSLVIGLIFIAGFGNALPDLQELLFGPRG